MPWPVIYIPMPIRLAPAISLQLLATSYTTA